MVQFTLRTFSKNRMKKCIYSRYIIAVLFIYKIAGLAHNDQKDKLPSFVSIPSVYTSGTIILLKGKSRGGEQLRICLIIPYFLKTRSQPQEQKNMDKSSMLCFIISGVVIIWLFLLVSVFDGESSSGGVRFVAPSESTNTIHASVSIPSPKHVIGANEFSVGRRLREPLRYAYEEQLVAPAPMEEIERNMTLYLNTLHTNMGKYVGRSDAHDIWESFVDTTKKMPMTWDEQNRYRFPKPRNDNSIFVSLGSYRDPFCAMTVKSLYSQAKHPERLFVGLFQQNCFGPKCKTGVLVGGKVEEVGPDDDCYQLFCESSEGMNSNACRNGNLHLFNVNESESLGPYMARYMGAKFYRGEQYYLQIDSHSEFVEGWDDKLIHMVETANAEKPVISTYPPDSKQNWKNTVGFRMCDSEIAKAQIEWQIIRLTNSQPFDKAVPDIPKYAPFVAAGFLFLPATFLHEVPFDPFLPWIFMGEEISMSARLWTSGYDIFSPTMNVLNHYYVRRHYPKFWETTNRFFKNPAVHNNIVELVINRVKCMLGYPESRPEMVSPPSILYRHEEWGMGNKRSYDDYLKMVGINFQSKSIEPNKWCHKGEWPEIAKQYYVEKKAGRGFW